MQSPPDQPGRHSEQYLPLMKKSSLGPHVPLLQRLQFSNMLQPDGGAQSTVSLEATITRGRTSTADVVTSVRSSASFTWAFMTPHITAAFPSKVFFFWQNVFSRCEDNMAHVCVCVCECDNKSSSLVQTAACDYVARYVYRHTPISLGGGEFPSGENRFLSNPPLAGASPGWMMQGSHSLMAFRQQGTA